MNPLTTYYTSSHARNADTPQRMDIDVASSGSTMSTASPDRFPEGRASSINLDDPDVLLAAEALGDLRAGMSSPPSQLHPIHHVSRGSTNLMIRPDFVSSPPNQPTPLPANSPQGRSAPTAGPEPLLSLLTTSHPLIATTIEGATSVYNNGKNLNPTIRNSVEYVEGYLGPIATTFGSVSRATGVDGGVRWFLGGVGRRDRSSTSDLEAGGSGSNKRRKVDTSPQDVVLDGTPDKPEFELYGFTSDRRTSMSTVDTLPAYDEFRSPAYSETADAQARVALRPNPGAPAAWPHRLMLSTSGLSIAMREESLRSLKYCLNWLRWANEHIAKVIAALNTALDQYERSADGSTSGDPASQRQSDHDMQDATTTPTMSGSVASQHDRGEIAARIVALKGDVLKTLRGVIETVSKYAGGALPDNARSLVHRHLTSLPQRFLLATKQDMSTVQQGHGVTGEEEVREGAQRALVLAKEGLDMMAQVSGVLDGTIVSAEEWCELLRKKKGDDQGASAADPTSEPQPPPADGTEAR